MNTQSILQQLFCFGAAPSIALGRFGVGLCRGPVLEVAYSEPRDPLTVFAALTIPQPKAEVML